MLGLYLRFICFFRCQPANVEPVLTNLCQLAAGLLRKGTFWSAVQDLPLIGFKTRKIVFVCEYAPGVKGP